MFKSVNSLDVDAQRDVESLPLNRVQRALLAGLAERADNAVKCAR